MDETTALKKFDNLALKLAQNYASKTNHKCEFDDLYQAARIGIVNACRTFDTEAGVKFITHAWNCAKHSITKHIRDNGALIRIPASANAEECVKVVDSESVKIFLEMKTSDDEISSSDQSILLSNALNEIPENQRNAVQMVYIHGMTYEEAASELDVSRQYAHQLTTRGLESLKKLIGTMP
jgi:RNA polymerase sigma factor (sigma-70 family)